MGRFEQWKKDIYEHKTKILLMIIFFLFSVVIDYYNGIYTMGIKAAATAPDLILDAIKPIDLSIIFVWLYVLIWMIIFGYALFFKPRKIHYSLGIISLFILTRSIFTTLTHLATPLDVIQPVFPGILQLFNFRNDLFFSGHTGLPFLAYLMFGRDNKILGIFFLISSLILGFTVLVMHQHYSIDVFAAFFITYGVYKIGNRIFDHAKT